ncbi:MAG TPA: site-specific DNA-methyltransferase [Gemmataceae bacterium]|jgi:site-specific DNA-methyltransferase (cytosine-N4-specific)|nr:site-specific DNA-methyltransferase [Gemmataceae bacterium]
MYTGLAESALATARLQRWRGRVQLLFTSPPFPLQREKRYGNLQGDSFAAWLAGFANTFSEYLTANGSIVIELGNGWNPGLPTMSTASLKALLAFQEAANLHLCQEFICFNPARLPTPAEWVAVRRVRVKDSFTRVWWLSPTPHPKADNRRVLTDYSASMKKLLQRGTYNGGVKRPSEHHISATAFLTNNGGAIPPNVLVPPHDPETFEPLSVLPIANTSSNDSYRRACRAKNITGHPAVMPEPLVAFFVQMLTDPGDVVLDPFAGSNTTGYVAEKHGRRWLGIEANPDYAKSSRIRFETLAHEKKDMKKAG